MLLTIQCLEILVTCAWSTENSGIFFSGKYCAILRRKSAWHIHQKLQWLIKKGGWCRKDPALFLFTTWNSTQKRKECLLFIIIIIIPPYSLPHQCIVISTASGKKILELQKPTLWFFFISLFLREWFQPELLQFLSETNKSLYTKYWSGRNSIGNARTQKCSISIELSKPEIKCMVKIIPNTLKN